MNVTTNQAAYTLAVSNEGEVAVAAGAGLSVTAGTGVSGGGVLSVNPDGAFSTGGPLSLDSGGSLAGGPIAAAAYLLDDGTASTNLSGPGGLTKDTSGTVILSGANSYAGGTWVRDGTLIVTTASALPSGTSLTVGGGGIFVFDPSQAAAPSSAAGSAAIAPDIAAARETSSPIVAASAVVDMPVVAFMISAVSPFLQSQLENPYCGPVATEISTGPATAAAASDVVDAPPAATRRGFVEYHDRRSFQVGSAGLRSGDRCE